MRYQFDTLIFASLPIFKPDTLRVYVVQIQASATFFGDAGRERNFYPQSLDARRRVVCALPYQVRGMRNYATRHIGKSVPLLEKVIPAVIANAVEESSVGITEFRNVRSIENDLAAIRDGRLEFVHALGAGPDVVIHLGQDRKSAAKRTIFPSHVLSC